MVVLIGLLAGLLFTTSRPVHAGECSIYAYPQIGSGGKWNDKPLYLVVHRGVRGDGYFLYQMPGYPYWYARRWSTVDGTAHYTRFGVSTAWAYNHASWNIYTWYYVYDC